MYGRFRPGSGTHTEGATDTDVGVLAIDQSDAVTTLMNDPTFILEPSLSPAGAWMVYYRTDEPGGPPEIDIRPFPDVGQQRRPVGAGLNPVFSSDGSELFFLDDGGLSAVSVDYAPFRVGPPKQLFRGVYWYGGMGPNGAFGRAWAVDPKNDRFLMITLPGGGDAASDDQSRPHINVVLNWLEELNERVPRP
jgi:hypothetical protein